jgi:hypothetical protein
MLPVFFFHWSSVLTQVTADPPREPQPYQGERQYNKRISKYGIHLLYPPVLFWSIYVSTSQRTKLSFEQIIKQMLFEVEYHHRTFGESWVNHMMIWDIYESEKYGTVNVTHMVYWKPEYHTSQSVSGCEVNGNTCKTTDEFNTLASSYMRN